MINWIAIIKAVLFVFVFYLLMSTVVTMGLTLFMLDNAETLETAKQVINKNESLARLLGDAGLFLAFLISSYFFEAKKLLHMSIVALAFNTQSLLSVIIYNDSVKDAFMNSAIVFAIMFAAYSVIALLQKLKR